MSDDEETPYGFSFAGIAAGLKDSKKKDLALILAPENSICSGLLSIDLHPILECLYTS